MTNWILKAATSDDIRLRAGHQDPTTAEVLFQDREHIRNFCYPLMSMAEHVVKVFPEAIDTRRSKSKGYFHRKPTRLKWIVRQHPNNFLNFAREEAHRAIEEQGSPTRYAITREVDVRPECN